MGTTLKIAHNVFDKVKVEKDRKERLKDFDDWQKEKARKTKALAEFQANLRSLRESRAQENVVKEYSNNSVTSVDDEDKDEKTDLKTGARRKTSRPYNRSSFKNVHHKDSISSTSSMMDEHSKRKVFARNRSNTNTELEKMVKRIDLKDEICKRKSIPDSHDNVQRRKEKNNHWLVLKGNLHSAKNRKASLSKNFDKTESSTPKNSNVCDGRFRCTEEDEKVPSAEKINSNYEREDAGCGQKLCTIS